MTRTCCDKKIKTKGKRFFNFCISKTSFIGCKHSKIDIESACFPCYHAYENNGIMPKWVKT